MYFGTFNPIHVGHLIIANFMVEQAGLKEVWLVVSPQNPLKDKANLLNDQQRLAMVQVAVKDNPKLQACDIEFNLPQPSYTINTLKALSDKYHNLSFSLIMGEDNLRNFTQWKGYNEILNNYSLLVYPRPLTESEHNEVVQIGDSSQEFFRNSKVTKVTIYDAPVMKVSATYIRQAIKNGKDVRYLLTDPVHDYLKNNKLYED